MTVLETMDTIVIPVIYTAGETDAVAKSHKFSRSHRLDQGIPAPAVTVVPGVLFWAPEV